MSGDTDTRDFAEKLIDSLDAVGIDVDKVAGTKKGDERAYLVWEDQQDEKEYRERQRGSRSRGGRRGRRR